MDDLFSQLEPSSQKPSKKGEEAKKEYTAENIEILEGLEPVRRRPGMYIGGQDEAALHHLVTELIDNAIDEAHNDFQSCLTEVLRMLINRNTSTVITDRTSPLV
jgi:DNA gyrase/topoisomerase IV subunit B